MAKNKINQSDYFFIRKSVLYLIFFYVILIAVSILFFKNQFMPTGRVIEINEAEILERLKQFPEIEPYTNYPASVTLLTEQDIRELAKKQPVIYEGLPGNVYRVEFTHGKKGLLVIYDWKENLILRKFELMYVELD